MANDTLLKDKSGVETLKNYLYNNRLKEEEIDRRLTEFSEKYYMMGISHGDIISKNNSKRIKNAINKCRDAKFNVLMEIIDDEHDQLILNSRKKK